MRDVALVPVMQAALLLLSTLPALTGVSGEDAVVVRGSYPQFVRNQFTSVVAPLGHAATLHCSVLRQGDKAVSWVRSRDLQILSHAGAVFTADARVGASEERAGDGDVTTHALRLHQLRADDAGRYECQLNTEPKMSLFFNLTVVDEVVPRVVVSSVEGGEVVGEEGGTASLWCSARYSPAPRLLPLPPLQVRWSRVGPAADTWLTSRGGVSRDTERWATRVVSRLELSALRPEDAGDYVCSAADHSLTVRLRVLPHESSAEAMQRDEGATSGAGRGRAWGRGTLCAVTAILVVVVVACAPR